MSGETLDLFATAADRSLDERFQRFHRDHPEVYRRLVEILWRLKQRGRRASIRDAFGYLRIEREFEGRDGDAYILNNSFTASYARLIQAQEPGLDGVIQTRERRSA